MHRSRWSRPLVGISAVVVIGAALGAVFGIRAGAGLGDGSAPVAAAQPSARTGAAMAYDAADQSIVLFGGQSRTKALDDTWTWNGSGWTQQHPATSPPALENAQMAYDPVTHDVILVGMTEPAGSMLPIACSSGSGSASSGSTTGDPSLPPPDASIPDIAPVPSATPKAKGSTVVTGSACGTSVSPKAVTWSWSGSTWSRFGGATPLPEFANTTLVTDPAAGRVVLFTTGQWAVPGAQRAEPALACPLQSAATPSGESLCPYMPAANLQWTWTGHGWTEMSTNVTSQFNIIGSSIVEDGVTGKLATFSSGNFVAPTPAPATCPTCTGGSVALPSFACCSGIESIWNGTTWKKVATYDSGPSTYGVTFVGDPAAHSDVVLTGDGATWLWTGTWKHVHPATTPPIVSGAAAAYDAATGQVVMFGGYGDSSHATGLYDQTWTWDGTNWSKRGGTSGPSVAIPVPSPVSVPPGLPCEPATKVPVAGSGVAPATVCNGTPASGSGSTGSSSGAVGSSGVAAP
jgi:hypothetical protein